MSSIASMPVAKWREAWTEIAVAFETEPSERTKWQWRLAPDGLCFAMRVAVGDVNFRRYDVYHSLTKYGRRHNADPYWYHHDRTHDLLRATHAAFFAAMTPKEFIQICGGEDE